MTSRLKLFIAVLSTVTCLGLIIAAVSLFRYEYDANKLKRVDRLSGEIQISCPWERWRFVAVGQCHPPNANAVREGAEPRAPLNTRKFLCENRNEWLMQLRERGLQNGERFDPKAPPWEIKPWLAPDWKPDECPE